MITITRNPSGVPIGIQQDGQFIPIDPRNNLFADFVAWNAEQPEPMDYTAVILPECPTA